MRLLKSTAHLQEITSDVEDDIHKASRLMSGLISTAALYETLQKDKFPAELQLEPPDKWVAASVYIVTVGEAAEARVMEAQKTGETTLPGQILHSIALETLEQSGNFIRRLLDDEAKEETCELSQQKAVNSETAWAKLLELLPGDKIGVKYLGSERFAPMYTTGGIIYWTPVKKRR